MGTRSNFTYSLADVDAAMGWRPDIRVVITIGTAAKTSSRCVSATSVHVDAKSLQIRFRGLSLALIDFLLQVADEVKPKSKSELF